MWSCSQFDLLDHWSCRCWSWICRNLLGSSDHCRLQCPASETSYVYRIHWWNVRHCFRSWTTFGRSLHRQSNLEMVLLYQSSNWCNHYGCDRSLLQSTWPSSGCQHWLQGASQGVWSLRNGSLHPGYHLPSISSTMGWNQIRLVKLENHPIVCLLWRLDLGLYCHSILETGHCNYPSSDHEKEKHVVCSMVQLLCRCISWLYNTKLTWIDGLLLPPFGILLANLVPSRQGRDGC